MKFWVERKDNALMPLETAGDAAMVTESHAQLLPYLHVEATFLPIQLAESSRFKLENELDYTEMQKEMAMRVQKALWKKYPKE
jgi:hypothetical protein